MNNRAVVLVITLWIITLLSTVVISLVYRMRIELQLVSAQGNRAKSFAIAKAGLVQAVNVLDDDRNGYDAFGEKWSNCLENMYDINLFRNINVGEGVFNVSYLYGKDIFTGSEHLFYGMEDESRKININKATQDMLESLPGVTSEIATSIRAWRGDPELSAEKILGEDAYYKGLSKPYERKGKEFECIEELLLVRGLTQDLLFGSDLDGDKTIDINEKGLSQYLTVYGDGLININTASLTVLRALGFSEDLSYRILLFREGPDEIDGTEDDGIFTSTGSIATDLGYVEPLLPDEVKMIEDKKSLLTVSSRYYTANIEGSIPGKAKSKVRAVIDKEAENDNNVVKWVEE